MCRSEHGRTIRYTDARNAGNAIWKMLADFDEDSWHEKVNSGTIKEWQQHYIED